MHLGTGISLLVNITYYGLANPVKENGEAIWQWEMVAMVHYQEQICFNLLVPMIVDRVCIDLIMGVHLSNSKPTFLMIIFRAFKLNHFVFRSLACWSTVA